MKYEWEAETQVDLAELDTDLCCPKRVILGFIVCDRESVEGAIIMNPHHEVPTSFVGADIMQDVLVDAQSLYDTAREAWSKELRLV